MPRNPFAPGACPELYRRAPFAFFLLLIILLFVSCAPAHDEDVFVYRVIDGDTIVTSVGTVRLLGIDAPEEGECGYEEARDALTGLVAEKNVELIPDDSQEDRDKYGRYLRYVELSGKDVGEELVGSRFVKPFPWLPSVRLVRYDSLYDPNAPLQGCRKK